MVAGHKPLKVLYSPEVVVRRDVVNKVLGQIGSETPLLEVSEDVLSSVSDTVTSQGIIAAFELLSWHPREGVNANAGPVLVLDRVSDPGNVGTLLRSAAAAGSAAVLLSEGSADPYNPKAVRASAGALFAVSFAVLPWEEIHEVLHTVPKRFAAYYSDSSQAYYLADLCPPCAILVGSEASGLSHQALSLSTHNLWIPMQNNIESLNAAVAGSILLFESRRQMLIREGR